MQYPSTHKTLLEKVRNGDEVSWEEFYQRYSQIIRDIGSLYRFNSTECDDLVQNVMLRFFSFGKNFEYREGQVRFRSYFAMVIRSQAVDMIRSQAKQKNLSADPIEEKDPFESKFMDEWRKIVWNEALEELQQRVSAKNFQAFLFFGLQNRPLDDVCSVLHMTSANVYLAKSRCTAIMKKIVQRLNATDPELTLDVSSR